jgi:hypothetical protein
MHAVSSCTLDSLSWFVAYTRPILVVVHIKQQRNCISDYCWYAGLRSVQSVSVLLCACTVHCDDNIAYALMHAINAVFCVCSYFAYTLLVTNMCLTTAALIGCSWYI